MSPGDGDLVERLRGGDHEAFEALYRRHKDRLYRHALVQSGGRRSIAEEVVQDVFLSLFEGRISPDRNVGGYLLAAARNRALNAITRRESHTVLDGEGAALLVAKCADPEGELHRVDEARVLAEALLELSPEQREVVLLRTFEGLAWKQVAELMATSVPTASSRYRAALERLRTTCRSLSHA